MEGSYKSLQRFLLSKPKFFYRGNCWFLFCPFLKLHLLLLENLVASKYLTFRHQHLQKDLTKTRTYPERTSTTFNYVLVLVQNVIFSMSPQKKCVLVLVQNVIFKILDFQLHSGFSTEGEFKIFRTQNMFCFSNRNSLV